MFQRRRAPAPVRPGPSYPSNREAYAGACTQGAVYVWVVLATTVNFYNGCGQEYGTWSRRQNGTGRSKIQRSAGSPTSQHVLLDYVRPRRHIYLPLYVQLLQGNRLSEHLRARHLSGKDLLIIVEVDGPHDGSLTYLRTKVVPCNNTSALNDM